MCVQFTIVQRCVVLQVASIDRPVRVRVGVVSGEMHCIAAAASAAAAAYRTSVAR